MLSKQYSPPELVLALMLVIAHKQIDGSSNYLALKETQNPFKFWHSALFSVMSTILLLQLDLGIPLLVHV